MANTAGVPRVWNVEKSVQGFLVGACLARIQWVHAALFTFIHPTVKNARNYSAMHVFFPKFFVFLRSADDQ